MTTETPEFLYRYEDRVIADRGVNVEMRKFKVVKTTPKGYWIKLFDSFEDTKWVSNCTKRRFAYPTISEALTNFKARKRRQIEILQAQLNDAKVALRTVDPEGEYQERSFSRWPMESL